MFNDPQLYQKLAKNSKTSPYLADPAFMAKLQRLAKNPSEMGQELGDPRMLQVMSVLLGIDLSMGDPSAGGPSARGHEQEDDVPMPDARPSSRPPPPKAKEPSPEPDPEAEETSAAKTAKDEADAETTLATESDR